MFRTILCGAVVSAAALMSVPSASAEPICVRVVVERPAAHASPTYCVDYMFGTACGLQGGSLGTWVDAVVYFCIPRVIAAPTVQ